MEIKFGNRVSYSILYIRNNLCHLIIDVCLREGSKRLVPSLKFSDLLPKSRAICLLNKNLGERVTYITEESQPVTVGSAAKLIPHMTGTWCTAFRSVADPIKEMYYFTAILSQLSKHKRGQKWTQENSKQVTGKFGNLKTGSWECANKYLSAHVSGVTIYNVQAN